MKRSNLLFLLFMLCVPAFFSCERDLKSEGISRVTNYPILTMAGEQFRSIPVGGSFTDEGVTATEGGATINVTVSGDQVDPNTPGVYVINYTAVNKDGFSASTKRYIGVIAPDAAALDLSGNYKRNAGALGVSKVTKVGVGHYTTDNVGGVAAGSPATSIHFFHTTGTKLVGPEQFNGSTTFAIVNGSYKFAAGSAPAEYTWTVINPGYGATPRTFVKQ